MKRFRPSGRAETDFADIRQYIAGNNVTAPDKFVRELFDLFQLLSQSPQIGEERPDLRPELRSISHGNYVVFYYPAESGAQIVGVVHGARDIGRLFREG